MLSTTPIALMKTTSEVLPAEMNGNGSPVGGIEPDTTQTLFVAIKMRICSISIATCI